MSHFACPYKGLIPYGEEDAPLFFGREKWCTIILDNLLASHLTLLYGTSGVGKSSVLLAGVASRLRKQARKSIESSGSSEFAVIVCRDWRDNPLTTLRAQIVAEVQALIGRPPAGEKELADDLCALLKSCSQAICRTEEAGLAVKPRRLLLILDQFEEYFLYHPHEGGDGTFADEFPRALNDPDLSMNVLISLRDDSLAKLDRFKTQIPDLFANRLQIDHLDRDAAIDAIRKPIEEFNRHLPADSRKASVEPQLVQDVLDQVKVGQINAGEEESSDQPSAHQQGAAETLRVETPFLQLVMMRLWEEESRADGPPRLRQETLSRLGGAGTIVREHLQRLMEGLPESSKRVAAIIFDKLVTSGLTKIAYPVFELTDPAKVDRPEDLVNRQELRELLDQLSSGSQRILRRLPPSLEQTDAEERYEIFHDVLARPILEWRRSYRQDAERKTERQRHAEELERERQELERERHLRRRNLSISVGVGAVLGTIIAGLSLKTLQLMVQEQKLKGIEAAQQFKAQQLDQLDALIQALVAADSLSRMSLVFDDRRDRDIASNLRHILDNIEEISAVDLLTPEDNSARVLKLHPDGRSVGILFQNNQLELRNLQRTPTLRLTGAPTGIKFLGFTFAGQGKKIATVSGNGEIQIWDAQGSMGRMTHRTREPYLKENTPSFFLRNSLHFTPDGSRLGFVDKDRTLRILDLSQRASVVDAPPLALVKESIPEVTLLRFSPNGKLLATATRDGEVFLLEAATGRRLPAPSSANSSGPIFSLEFDDDGESLAIASPVDVRLWLKDQQGRWKLSLLRAGRTSQVRFSPDGRLLATASLDGRTRLWAVRSNKEDKAVASFLNQAPVQDLRFIADGKRLITVSIRGTVHEWKVPAVPEPVGPARQVSALAFSPGAHWLARSAPGDRSPCLLQLNGPGRSSLAEASPSEAPCVIMTPPPPLPAEPSGRLSWPALAQLEFSPDESTVVGLAWRGRGFIWNRQGKPTLPLKILENGPFSPISFSPDGQRFAFVARGGEENKLLLCQMQPNQAPKPCQDIKIPFVKVNPVDNKKALSQVTSVRFMPRSRRGDGNLLLSSADGQLCFASMAAGQDRVKNLRCKKVLERVGSVWQLYVSSDSSMIGLAGFDGTLHLFNNRFRDDHVRKALPEPLKVSAGPIRDVTFSPQGPYLAAVSLDGTASLWDLQGRQLATFPGDEDGVGGFMKATFSSNGTQLLLATTLGTLKVKDVEDLPKLLKRGCYWLRPYLENPATDQKVRERLSFCKSLMKSQK